MDRVPIPFPHASTEFDPLERDITEVDAAIELIATGMANRVRLANLSRPDAAAAHGAAVVTGLAVRIRLDGAPGEPRTVTIETAATE